MYKVGEEKTIHSIDDIEIFILTHNRSHYLEKAIDSILNQTVKVSQITVLDNESTDDTEEIVNRFHDSGVRYLRTEGFLGNYYEAKKTASREYCILFHDDDIMHPQYLQIVLNILNEYDDIALITTRYKDFYDDSSLKFETCIRDTHFLFSTKKEFAQHMYFIEHIAYATAVYRTKDFCDVQIEYERFNKFNDWPLMVKVSGKGRTVLLDDENLYLRRIHSLSDSNSFENFPDLEQIANWDGFFFDAMQLTNNTRSYWQRMFDRRCWLFLQGKYDAHLPEEYKRQHSKEELLKIAIEKGLHPAVGKPTMIDRIDSKLYRIFEAGLIRKNRKNSI